MMGRSSFHDDVRDDDDQTEIVVEFEWTAGEPATWEDPGCGPEIEITGAHIKKTDAAITLTDAERERIELWLRENFEEDDGPDPDDERDRRRDDAMTDRHFPTTEEP